MGILYRSYSKLFIQYAFYSCIAGIFLFSGSLYLLCLTNNPIWGMITPIGGVLLILSWILMLLSIKQSKNPNLVSLESSIEEKTGIKVLIRNKKDNSGQVIFEYKDLDQLNRLIMVIKTNY